MIYLSLFWTLFRSVAAHHNSQQAACPSHGILVASDLPQCPLAPGLVADSDSALWAVKLTPSKGRGVFATAAIAKGTPLLHELPLFSVEPPPLVPGMGYDLAAMARHVYARFRALSSAEKEQFLSCHEQRLDGDGEDEAARVMAILRSNAYTYTMHDSSSSHSTTRVGIYPKASL